MVYKHAQLIHSTFARRAALFRVISLWKFFVSCEFSYLTEILSKDKNKHVRLP